MVLLEKPAGHKIAFSVVSCLCVYKKQLLLVQRNSRRPFGLMWGVPTGKLENQEIPEDGIIREVQEETGMILQPQKLHHLQTFYVNHSGEWFRFILFGYRFDFLPHITLHIDELICYRWAAEPEWDNYRMVPDMKECLAMIKEKIHACLF